MYRILIGELDNEITLLFYKSELAPLLTKLSRKPILHVRDSVCCEKVLCMFIYLIVLILGHRNILFGATLNSVIIKYVH